ncbi:MAG: ribosome biogenesis GTP-binding protein YihA/YsxC [Clostridia bacterium]
MKINTAEFVKSAPSLIHCPTANLTEIAFIGRSNVGKSSLINFLVNRKKLARTSSAPGRTQTLNYYLINNEFYFVDFPGYGYAKVSKSERKKWNEAREEYLVHRSQLKAIVMVVDIRHDISPLDVQMLHQLQMLSLPYFVVLTKADKISRSKRNQKLLYFTQKFQVNAERLFVVSSEKRFGKESLIKELAKVI